MTTKIIGLMLLVVASMTASGGTVLTVPSSWKEDSPSTGSSGRRSSSTTEAEVREIPTTGTTTQGCGYGSYQGKEMSWNFLDSITKEIDFEDEVSVDKNGNLEGNIYLNGYISACFKPAITTVKKGGKIFVKIENVYFDESNKAERDRELYTNIANSIAEIAKKNISIDEKYAECLKKRGLVYTDKNSGQAAINIEKIKNEGLEASATLPYRNAISETGKDPIKLNKDRSYQLYFASNKTSGYGTPGEDRVGGESPGWDECLAYHELSKDGEPFIKGKLDRLKADIIDICDGSGDVSKKIRDVMKLRNTSYLSGFGVLFSAVDDILIKFLEKEQNKILEDEDTNLENIEDEMKRLVLESKRNADQGIVDRDLGDDAKKLSKKYQKILAKLKSTVYDPAQKLIQKLDEDYDKSRSGEERDRIEKKLEKFSEMMEKFSEGRKDESCRKMPCSFYKQFYIYEGKEHFRRDAAKFEGLRLASSYWGKSSKGDQDQNVRRSQRSLDPSSVLRKINVGMRKFKKRTNRWGREASVIEGDKAPIMAEKRRVSKAMERVQETYREGPYKGLSWWCQGANTKNCHKKRRRAEQMFRGKMQRWGLSIMRGQSQLSRYEELADQYRLRQEYEREQNGLGEEYDYYGDESYYGDDYFFPGFGNPGGNNQFQGPYDPSYYNLNPQGSPYDLGSPPLQPMPMGPRW